MIASEVNAIKALTLAIKELTRELKPKKDETAVFADNQEYFRFTADDILDRELVKKATGVLLDHESSSTTHMLTQWDAQEILRKFIEAGIAITRIEKG